MAIHLRRREFIFTLGGAATGLERPRLCRGQEYCHPMGITGYLENIAREHPAVMCGMLARLVPIQQESTQTVDVTYHSFEEINNRLRELGLPVGRIYPLLEAKKMKAVGSAVMCSA